MLATSHFDRKHAPPVEADGAPQLRDCYRRGAMSLRSLHAENSRYSSIDVLLGDSRTRFFGSGYRDIRNRISDVVLETREKAIGSTAAIEYPSAWSKKKDRELQPHLSSVDALAIATQLAETYLRAAYGIEAVASDIMRIQRCALKPGPTPTTDLEHVAARCTFLDTESTAEAAGGYRSRLSARVGTIAVDLSIEHPIGATRDVSQRWANLEEFLGPQEQSYYGWAHTRTDFTLTDVEFAPDDLHVSATLDVLPPTYACHCHQCQRWSGR